MNNSIYRAVLVFLVLIISGSCVIATIQSELSDQGTGVRTRSTGNLLTTGNLTVEIYAAASGGSPIYNETFTNAISNGSWSVMLGQNDSKPLYLQFNTKFYKDYKINGEDVSFTNSTGAVVARQGFYSSLGELGSGTNASGLYSVAMGGNTIANGTNAFAMGADTIASGFDSTALGRETIASKDYAVAMGASSNASGVASLATGMGSAASGNYSTATGYYTIASGEASTAMGFGSEASGDYSFAAATSTASGDFSIALGGACSAIGSESVALGEEANATGNSSIAMSEGIAIGKKSFAILGATTRGLRSVALSSYITYSDGGGFGAASSRAIGDGSFAIQGGVAEGQNSFARGSNIVVSGENSIGFGLYEENDTAPLSDINITQPNAFIILGGKVGINTTNPQSDLDVNGTINALNYSIGGVIGYTGIIDVGTCTITIVGGIITASDCPAP